MPFLSEMAWSRMKTRKIVSEESVMLAGFPKLHEDKVNLKLENEFDKVFKFIEAGLFERDKAKIGLRWPLASAAVIGKEKLSKELNALLMRQLNLKDIKFEKGESDKVVLNTKLTSQLEAEGYAREIARKIQSARKERNMKKEDRITLKLHLSEKLSSYLKPFKDFISNRVGASKITFVDDKESSEKHIFEVKGEKIGFNF